MSLVTIWISSTDSYSERRWTPHLTIAELRAKLQPITGISAGSQRLALSINPGGTTDRSILLDNDELTLLDYGVQEGATIDVVDTDPHSAALAGQYNDVSQVEKFELPIQEYEKRSDSLLAFKIRNKLGRFNDDQNKESEEECNPNQEELQAKYPLGSRCQITPTTISSNESPLRGTLKFIGPVKFNQKHPYWIGVELDEPRGKNNGSVDGHPYFECPPNRGIFIQPDRVTLGDYPPLDFLTGINDDDDDDDEI
ncbi:hypothetical protein MJO28_017625 [Puccinia striiformis f. sp. tritici]|uniref:CAP-Gly domain-containing protein n=1 Tax=Puccinia striiformis f. sp. tritici PST-78 TaxID=1165861 RepID=A0A0L0V0Y4_9BASI|nr:hypothetical protein Pst134EA_005527 [Puccinia striiformis f. sp. tritici]KNE92669.1 hypothetical protein PSTG_13936 [Puccinia striiformis f. sp. tritici PST-78]KAH9471643.1 hypothetical protein Pst134EA_005527 [Puccinia striiformis f. sp. tritici]KAI7933485.1 hypothetical protein MJO28_017625 [Puccinia striiformis f. sp. tritici]KAI7934102.1 hypothetical protein MJO29_016533 [Puccinia striiformis f. sp. tritici]KAI7964485.1 hypothetical protein MJO29_002583 [Puccinia striiformis f. sp. tri